MMMRGREVVKKVGSGGRARSVVQDGAQCRKVHAFVRYDGENCSGDSPKGAPKCLREGETPPSGRMKRQLSESGEKILGREVSLGAPGEGFISEIVTPFSMGREGGKISMRSRVLASSQASLASK